MMGWEITRACNLACPHCYSAASRKPVNEQSTSECIQIIDDLDRLGVKFIGWTGGEPLLRNDLEELIDYAGKKGMKSGITTNGILMDEKRALSIKKSGARSIQISLDGSSPEKNKAIRRATEEEFWKIMEAIRICRRLGLKINLAMLIGQENLDDAYAFVKLARKEKIDAVRFCGFVPAGRGRSDKIKKRLAFNDRLYDLKKFVEIYSVSENPICMFDPAFGPTPPNYDFHECIAGKEVFYLSSTGDVYPCTSLLAKTFRVGNIREKSLEEIWSDPEMNRVATIPRERIRGFCRKCRHFRNCLGACRGITYAHTGDLYESFPVCLKRASRKKTTPETSPKASFESVGKNG